MKDILYVNGNTFDNVVKENPLVVIDCYAEWCGPCKMMSKVFEDAAQELDAWTFAKMDVDDALNTLINDEYSIQSIPTLLVFNNGDLVDTIVGFQTKAKLINTLNAYKEI